MNTELRNILQVFEKEPEKGCISKIMCQRWMTNEMLYLNYFLMTLSYKQIDLLSSHKLRSLSLLDSR